MSAVVLAFDGWVQVRLATNPDPTDEPRGVSGYTFALFGEPDLDRVLRTANPVAPRTHGPTIGVFVRRVAIDGIEVPTHPLVGAQLELLGEPRFESVNEVVMEQGEEPLEPFDVQLTHAGGFRLQRRALLDPDHPDATVYTVPRKLLAARRADVSFSTEIMQEATGSSDPVAFRAARKVVLEKELAMTKDAGPRSALMKRISELAITDPTDHRTASMSFIERRHYELDGPTACTDPASWLGTLDTVPTWACDVTMGSWDADALSAYYTGTLTLPTR